MTFVSKSIIITESQIKPLIKSIILENRESKNQHNARVYLRNNGINENRAKQLLDAIRHDIPNARLAQCKYLVGICRYLLNNELNIMKMNGILPFIASEAHVNEYDSDFNGLSFENLYNQFKTIKDKSSEESRQQSYNKTNLQRNQDYKIYKISSYEEAKNFRNYTTWCVTQNDNAYKAYTSDGMGLFYFCVKNGFESLEEPSNKSGNPLDEYGLSMIAISVDEKGDLNTCTSRWNHDNNGNDHVMTKDQIEDLLGVNFYETFKPRYTKEEVERINREKDDKIRNIIKKVIQNDEFDEHYYKNGTSIEKVELVNGDIKYIVKSDIYGYGCKIFNSDLSLFINEKFYGANVLNGKNGFIIIYDNHTKNILLLDGSLLLEHNANIIRVYKNFICIQMSENSKFEIYDYNLRKITNETFDWAYEKSNDKFLKVENNGLENILSLNGSLLLKRGAYKIMDYTHFICVKMYEYSRYEIYDSKFKKVTNKTFDNVYSFGNYLVIDKNRKCNIMDINGNIILNKNYDNIYSIKNYNGYLFFRVLDGNEENVINRLGQRLFDENVNNIHLAIGDIVYQQNWNKRHMSYEEAIKRMH